MKKKEIQFSTARWGPLLARTKLDENLTEELLTKGFESRYSGKKQLDAKKYLAGRIENEFLYEDIENWLVPKISPYMNAYIQIIDQWTGGNSFGHLIGADTFPGSLKAQKSTATDISWYISLAWINFQQKGEYNPPHNHRCDLSFVAYLQVPKEIGLEFEALPEIEKDKGPGSICFSYGEELPFSIKAFGRYPEKGDLFIFPGWLTHNVLDFHCDVERISVSGNIHLEIVKKQEFAA